MLRLILTCVQVFSSFVIVGLVLLQRGKGAEAGAGFGAGASGTVFGARGATTALSRATAVFAAIFMINSLALAYLGTSSSKQEEAQTVFFDEQALLIADPDHSEQEERFVLLGLSSGLRTLVVCHCYRREGDVIRLISARRANRLARKA